MVEHCLGNSQINSISEKAVFFHSLQNKGKSLRVQLVRADSVHSRRENVFDPEKLTLTFHYFRA